MDSAISTLLLERQIDLDLQADTPADAIHTIASLLGSNPAVRDVERLCADILTRETVTSTVLRRGIALPHARTAAVSDIVLAVGRSRDGVRFDADGPPVQLIFVIGTPPHMISQYLGVVGALARLLKDETVRQCLLDAETVEEFIAVLG